MSTHTSDGVTVDWGDDLEQIARRALENVVPGCITVLEREVDSVLRDARAAWPVLTGTSRDGLRSAITIRPDGTIRGSVLNSVDYAVYVKARRLGGSGSAVVQLLRRPITEAAQRVATDLGPAITRALEG